MRYESVANRKFCKKDEGIMENKRTVLLADANEEFRSMLRARMEQSEEYTVAGETGDGTEALGLIEQREPDLAVIDLVLPGTDGVSLLRQLRELRLRTRVIVLLGVLDGHLQIQPHLPVQPVQLALSLPLFLCHKISSS